MVMPSLRPRLREGMVDRELRELHGFPNRALRQAVRRGTDRFPDDFSLAMSKEEP